MLPLLSLSAPLDSSAKSLPPLLTPIQSPLITDLVPLVITAPRQPVLLRLAWPELTPTRSVLSTPPTACLALLVSYVKQLEPPLP